MSFYLKCAFAPFKQIRSLKSKNFTVSTFSTIFRNWDWYGKDVIFLHFFQHVFSKFAKLDIFKMSKKRFPKHFCVFIFYFFGFLTVNTKILSVLFNSLEIWCKNIHILLPQNYLKITSFYLILPHFYLILSKFGSSKVKILQSQNFQLFFGIVTDMVRMWFFYTFLNMFFQKSQKWTFLKCPKNDFRNTFVCLFFIFLGSLL